MSEPTEGLEMGMNLKRSLSVIGIAGFGLAALAISGFGASGSESGPGTSGTRTIYNNCSPNVWNNVSHSIKLTHIEKHSHDSWVKHRGPTDLQKSFDSRFGAPNPIISESGFARGCWNILRWGDSHGTIETYTFDPYSGANRYHCKTTGDYVCYHQERPHADGSFHYYPDRLTGDTLWVNYKICMVHHPCPGTQNPPPHYP